MSAPRKRKHQSKEKLYPIVEEWLKTGERKKDLCQRHGIKVYVLDYWLRKYRIEKVSPVTTSNFTSISITKPAAYAVSEKIEISYSDGTVLRLPANFSIAQLRSLLPLSPIAHV